MTRGRVFLASRVSAIALVAGGCVRCTAPEPASKAVVVHDDKDADPKTPDYGNSLIAVARDIEKLKHRFPQLADFSINEHYRDQKMSISYGYKTHRSQRAGGWAAIVPNPDEDGVWFYIDFHEPNSTAQIHTQPVVPPLFFWDKKVMFLILEGKRTKELAGVLREILLRHGVTTEPRN